MTMIRHILVISYWTRQNIWGEYWNDKLNATVILINFILSKRTIFIFDINALYYRFEMTLPGMKKPLKPIPVFQQMPGEKKKQFFRRMDNTVKVCEVINNPGFY